MPPKRAAKRQLRCIRRGFPDDPMDITISTNDSLLRIRMLIAMAMNKYWETDEFKPTNIDIYHVKILIGVPWKDGLEDACRKIDEGVITPVLLIDDVRQLKESTTDVEVHLIAGSSTVTTATNAKLGNHSLTLRLWQIAGSPRVRESSTLDAMGRFNRIARFSRYLLSTASPFRGS